MNKLVNATDHPVLSFANEEWSRLLLASGNGDDCAKEVWIGTWGDWKAWQQDLLRQNGGEAWRDTDYTDEFVIMETDHQIVLSGKTERAALYAVYQYAREAWGLLKVYPAEAEAAVHKGKPSDHAKLIPSYRESRNSEPMPAAARNSARARIRWYAPRIERRGFVFETINEPEYLKEMVDWLTQQKINEIFFTFSLWDQVREELAPEIVKRGIHITLGGHSMKFFLSEEHRAPNTTADHPYTAKVQLDFRDLSWQEPMLRQITEYCRSVPNLTRISLWPEDIADRETEGFLALYMRFTERLSDCLAEAGLEVEVEHIAYNAGLAWNMLELSGTKPSAEVDTLFAFWGRDYRYGYDASPHDGDRRAQEALEHWAHELKESGRKLTIFEYYSDHYMLTNLFPFLPQRIMKDIAYYEQLNLLGIVNLVVPYRGAEPYPWKWAHGFNSFVFCQALWSSDLEEILGDYYNYYPENERVAVKALFEAIEDQLPAITSWNIPLFPARAVDPEKAAATLEQRQNLAAALEGMKNSIQSVIEHSQLNPAGGPYRYARHLIEYAEKLYRQWQKQ